MAVNLGKRTAFAHAKVRRQSLLWGYGRTRIGFGAELQPVTATVRTTCSHAVATRSWPACVAYWHATFT